MRQWRPTRSTAVGAAPARTRAVAPAAPLTRAGDGDGGAAWVARIASRAAVGMRALDVYTSVVDVLGRAGVLVILDNHIRCPSVWAGSVLAALATAYARAWPACARPRGPTPPRKAMRTGAAPGKTATACGSISAIRRKRTMSTGRKWCAGTATASTSLRPSCAMNCATAAATWTRTASPFACARSGLGRAPGGGCSCVCVGGRRWVPVLLLK